MNMMKPMTSEQLITDNLDIWTQAIKLKSSAGRGNGNNGKYELYGIKKLRELVLELAVRGLLVPQDPNDEPASELLKKIAAEKALLIKEGKIKKQKPLPAISVDEKPFELPMGWMWTRFQDISEYIQRGKGPKYSDKGKVRAISQKCIQWSGFDLQKSRFVDNDSLINYQEERFIKNNDLLWNSTGTGTVGRVNVISGIDSKTLVADSHVTVIRTLLINTSFLWVYIAAPGIQGRIEPTHENALVSGTTKQVELNTSVVINLPVPIPPLDEQYRIVTKVRELMALCDQLEQQTEASLTAHQTLVETLLNTLTNAPDNAAFEATWQRIAEHFDSLFITEHSIDQLKQTILQLAVMGKLVPQDPNDEPASELLKKIAAEKAKLIKEGKIKKQKPSTPITDHEKPFKLPNRWNFKRLGEIAHIFSGNSFKSEDFNESSGVKVIKITNAGVGELINTEDYLPEYFLDQYEQFQVYKGDLVLALTRPYISSGLKISICPKSYHMSLLNQRVAVIRTEIDNSFLYQFMQSEFVLGLYKKRFGSSGLQPNLKMNDVTALVIPVPPLAEQHRIVSKVNELMVLCDQLKARLNDARTTQLHLADATVEKGLT